VKPLIFISASEIGVQGTVLHLLGLDHERLLYHANGREQRLTDGHAARVVSEILESPPKA
jgi:hypothetical protein